jgi:GT2 family glycosyltransferase
MQSNPQVSVIVPSFRRVDYLVNCLNALQKQELRDIEVLCVVQHGDTETRHCIAHKAGEDPRFKEVLVSQPGLVKAMNAGLKAAVGEFVAFTDDDTQAPSKWLAVILAHFHRHPECGAVGGQDRLQCEDTRLSNPRPVKSVGRYSFFGRFAATHHCPIEQKFVVADLIKGVNMTYRRALINDIEIGEGLRGESGAQVGTEQGLAAAVTRAGMQLHFVKDAWVKHYISVRHGEGERLDMTTISALNASFNYSYTLWRYQKLRVAGCALAYTLLVGSWLIPGVPRLILSPSKWRVTLMHIWPNLNGALAGFRDRQLDPRKV